MRDDEAQVDAEVRVARSGVDAFSPAALRRRRAELSLSLSDLAMVAGVSEATVNAWELGKARPTPGPLAAVAAALGTQVADLAPVTEANMRLADLRHQVGHSQDSAAAAVALSRTRFAGIETGRREPRDHEVAALSQLYDVTEERVRLVWQRTRTARATRLANR